MSEANERLRKLLAAPGCTSVAPIFDPLSARIAEMLEWQVCKLSGSVGKYANLAVPDGVPLANSSDLVDVCRRITRVSSVPLVVDGDDGGEPLALRRSIRELEAAGVSGIELEDNLVPTHFTTAQRHSMLVSKEEHVAKLEAAVAARRDPSTVIIGRSSALQYCPLDEALDRITAYAKTGVDAFMLPGLGARGLSPNPREDVPLIQQAVNLPLCVSGLPRELIEDEEWMTANRVKLRYNGQAPFRMAVQAIHDALSYMKSGADATDLRERWAPTHLVESLNRTEELRQWDEKYTIA